MFPIELKALRRNLGLTQAEAGQALAANVDFPHGASAEEWAQWENGATPIPLHVVRAVETRLNQKYQAIDQYAEQIETQMQDGNAVVVLWYPEPNACPDLASWRISQSVAGEVAAMGGRVIAFDAEAYRNWRQGQAQTADTPDNRQRWAQEQFEQSR